MFKKYLPNIDVIFSIEGCDYIKDTNELEEERRLCYVAVTRAKKHLTILNAKRRMLFGNT